MKLWGGRFEKRTDKLVEEFTTSLPFDSRLYEQDIKVNEVHAMMLSKIGLLTDDETKAISKALKEIKKAMGKGAFKFKDSDEDIHTAVERALIEKLGPVGGKLRTGRSRNDQAVTDLRLYLKKETVEVINLVNELQSVLIGRAESDGETVMPGYTHLQKAQPILLGHHLMAYFFMLQRDKERFEDCLRKTDRLPLGSGALAGTTFEVDRVYAAKKLGFKGVIENSLDAVSDRDFAIDFMAAASVCMMHLSV